MTTLKTLDNLLNDLPPNPSPNQPHPTTNPLTTSLLKLTTAIALYNRSGALFAQKADEHFWPFAAGSWSRAQYDEAVCEAGRSLGKGRSVEEDLRVSRRCVGEAMEVLRRAEFLRDGVDEIVGGVYLVCFLE
ncbi:hypothetical protein M409DRAFT_28333 [Zasmidium cellare ATCC 36951]|uniref:Uncharacterized protein n=1 Tax=Zasmidium cellare ATCC 36951 TaxID=1080233 RepID=A0A6A6C2G6_ZASCE|nr:uncharacterized protein M409DRAFT_28333 [Zasmidium cellare ATCC 36951]KAF2161294.1 hypothetical protein M409DRAFT_28333 [Zasmidium cellare ATCC 36951]